MIKSVNSYHTNAPRRPAAALPEKLNPVELYVRDERGHAVHGDFGVLFGREAKVRNGASFDAVDRSELKARQERLESKREKALTDIRHSPSNKTVIPKDGTLNPTTIYMAHMPDDPVSAGFIAGMSEIGSVEGFHMTACGNATALKDLNGKLSPVQRENVTQLRTVGRYDVWREDHGEMTRGMGTSVPAFVGDAGLIRDSLMHDRVERFYGKTLPPTLKGEELSKRIKSRYPRADFSVHGAVDSRKNQQGMIALGMAKEKPVRQNLGYVEGGNMLPGTLPNGDGYALVGKDSVAVTKAVLERDLGREVTDRETILALAKDLGMKPQNVHPVEQPGEFHIDMAMALIGPGQALVNDSKAAAAQQCEWLKEDYRALKPEKPATDATRLQKKAYANKLKRWKGSQRLKLNQQLKNVRSGVSARTFYEDKVVKDLKAAGLDVLRMGAVFFNPDKPEQPIANFTNCRQGVNEQGQHFFIGLGGPERAESFVAQQLLEKLDTGIDRIYFLDRDLTQGTLDMWGGIKCRTKTEGTIAL